MSQKKHCQTDNPPLPVAPGEQDFGVPRQQRERLLSLYDQDAIQAAEYADQLVGAYPQNAFLWEVLGNSRLKLGEYEHALQALERADFLAPDDALIANSLAQAHYALGDHERALALQKRCIELDPEYARGHFNLAQRLNEAGDPKGALKHLEEAERLGFDKAQVLHYRIAIQSLNFAFSEGLHNLKKLLESAPDNAGTHNACGNYYKDMAELELAERHYLKALELAPSHATAYSNLVTSMHYDPRCTHQQIVDVAKQWESRFAPTLQRLELPNIDTRPEKRLRLGLVSSGFRFHPVGEMITVALEHLPDDLELYIYSGDRAHDPITERIRKACTVWHSVHHLDDRQLADRIREDGIDILIDLAGHGHGSRLGSVCMRPAPLIVKWVGMQISTTGISAFDYFLSDNIETPPGVDPWYVEKIIRMPDDYICYLPPPGMPAITALPAIGNRHITLGCFNNPAKVNNVLLVEWAKLMHELPDSRLLLKGAQYSSPEVCARIRSVMEEQGIASERLILEGPSRHQELLETYNRVDIALDPWPYSGGLTTCEALMMGVPVVTLPGPTFAGRHSATHLVNAGMPELVVDSWEEYRRRVIELASDLPNLAVIRACLRRVVEASPLCDGERFARHLHTALRSIWQRHCEGKKPAALTLDKEGQAWFEDETQPVVVQRPPVDIAKKVGFDFGVQGKIIALDNGGQLVGDTQFAELQKLDIFATLAFDPSDRLSDIQRLQQRGELHHYPQVVLGDGLPATLYLCQDPAMSATLEPLQAERQLPGNRQATQVIGEQLVATLRLDDIEGLESIDWLLLDNLNDSLKVLENGEKALANTLLVQARVNFVPTHEHQPELTLISHWLSRHGFCFYRLNNFSYYSHFHSEPDIHNHYASRLVQADAIFIPSNDRILALGSDQKKKLSFILYSVYSIKDLAYEILKQTDPGMAERYLWELDLAARASNGRDALVHLNSSHTGSGRGVRVGEANNNKKRNGPSLNMQNYAPGKSTAQGQGLSSLKGRFIHICFNNMHIQNFIDTLSKSEARAGFDHTLFIERSRSVPGYDVDIRNAIDTYYFDQALHLEKVIADCLRSDVLGIFFHGLFFDWQRTIVERIGNRKRKIWVIWGGDLYNPIKIGKPLKEVDKYIDAITQLEKSENQLFLSSYAAKRVINFRYGFEFECVQNVSEKKKVIFIGNSGDPSNNHAEVLNVLAGKKDISQYALFIPFAYNGSEQYLCQLKQRVMELGLKNVKFIEEMMPSDEYLRRLSEASLIVTAHDRQQAWGNIIAATYFRTAVVLKKNISIEKKTIVNSTWEYLSNSGIQVTDYADFIHHDSIELTLSLISKYADRNREIILEKHGSVAITRLMANAFHQVADLEER